MIALALTMIAITTGLDLLLAWPLAMLVDEVLSQTPHISGNMLHALMKWFPSDRAWQSYQHNSALVELTHVV